MGVHQLPLHRPLQRGRDICVNASLPSGTTYKFNTACPAGSTERGSTFCSGPTYVCVPNDPPI